MNYFQKKSLCIVPTVRDIDSVSKNHKKYYHQTFSEDCKHKFKEKILKRYINEVLTDFDSDSDCKGDNSSDPDFDSAEKRLLCFRFSRGNLKSFIFLTFLFLCFIFHP